MLNTISKSRLLFTFFVIIILVDIAAASDNRASKKVADEMFKKAKEIGYTNIDSSIILLQKCLNFYEKYGDTTNSDKTKVILLSYYSTSGKYNQAYEIAMEMYTRFEEFEDVYFQIELLRKLTVLYLLFDQHKKANELFFANFEKVQAKALQNNDSTDLQIKLYNLSAKVESQANTNYLKAEAALLKSIQLLPHSKIEANKHFTKLRLAELYITMYKIDDAGELLSSLKKQQQNTSQSFNSQLFNILGKYYMKKNQADSAIIYFEKSLSIINKTQRHENSRIDILNNLSDLHFLKGNYLSAYQFLKESKSINESLFGSKSNQNKEMFEMRDNYTSEIKEQKLSLLEKEKRILHLRYIIYIGSLLIAMTLIMVYFIRRGRKEKIIRKIKEEKQHLEIRNKEKELELKNKELLSSAMQLLERDTQLNEINNQLNTLEFKEANEPIIHKIVQSLKVNRSQKWEEFDVHFTAVNDSFFALLKDKYPTLTKTDLKICAFIKLGFSSKDMAQIMGLGAEGINTTRYRIRKKMGINKGGNLVEFLQKFN